jgi:UPF0755 protein
MRMFLRIIRAALVLVHLIILSLAGWLFFESLAARGAKPQTVLFDVDKGKGVRAIAAALEQKGIIRKQWRFVLQYEFFFFPKSLKAGEYQFRSSQSTQEILEDLIRGKIYLHPVTIAEGLTARELIADFLAAGFGTAEEFIKAFDEPDAISAWDEKARNLEGYLFPETYFLPKSIPAGGIFEKMVSQFKAVFDESWRRRASELRMSVRDVVTLASLIEKETSLPEEKRLVSSVFHNRLRRGMRLDCDPTIIYALKQKGHFEGRLHAKDIKLDSPYNTYLYPGLPPGPICNPGKGSLRAALDPAPEDYLYFVSRNDGSHAFNRSLKEHQMAVKRYQN